MQLLQELIDGCVFADVSANITGQLAPSYHILSEIRVNTWFSYFLFKFRHIFNHPFHNDVGVNTLPLDFMRKTHNGEAGDAAIGFFKPVEGGEGERWVMVTNALTDRAGDAAACSQQITLNFVLKEGETIQKVSRTNGKLEPVVLKKVGEAGRSLLVLDLAGGTGDLLCLTTAAAAAK